MHSHYNKFIVRVSNKRDLAREHFDRNQESDIAAGKFRSFAITGK